MGSLIFSAKESSFPLAAEPEDLSEKNQVAKPVDVSRRNVNFSYSSSSEPDRNLSGVMLNNAYSGREESVPAFNALERERVDMKNSYSSSSSHKLYSSAQNTFNAQDEEKVPKVSPPRRKVPMEEKPEKQSNWARKDSGSELPNISHKHQQSFDSTSNITSRQYEQEGPYNNREINAILEVKNVTSLTF